MPINSYAGQGNTFVAFIDISGFKAMMNEKNPNGESKAIEALRVFYQTCYDILGESTNSHINGVLVSDCGVLFVRNDRNRTLDSQRLGSLLKVIARINRTLVEEDILLTTSIAWADFTYEDKLVFSGITKSALEGNAYLNAYLDNTRKRGRIKPGECRIVFSKNNPNDRKNLKEVIRTLRTDASQRWCLENRTSHCYFHWGLTSAESLPSFKQQYNDAWKIKSSAKYTAILQLLKDTSTLEPSPTTT